MIINTLKIILDGLRLDYEQLVKFNQISEKLKKPN